MAFRHGKNAELTLNSKALSTFLTSLETSWDLDTADTTTFGATWKSALAGIPGGSISLAGYYDPTATTGPADVLWSAFVGAVPVTGLIYPGGNVAGQRLWTITSGCLVTSYKETSQVNGNVAFTATIDVVVLPVPTVVGA
jgi:hypothetical protein